MPPELPNDQVLTLKKRARRRLVGAIALVLVMVILLPNLLEDRAKVAPQNPISITMPEPVQPEIAASEALPNTLESPTAANEVKAELPQTTEVTESQAQASKNEAPEVSQTNVAKEVSKEAVKKAEATSVIAKESDHAKLENTSLKPANIRYLIQVGVYSDEANVKQLQAKITQAGFSSHTENISTVKGTKIRLRVGSYETREAAAQALTKLERVGLSGMVMTND